ncbi:MAG TPA: hypothetical protein ENI23_09490 [bacterium]|nr:hypothetical protein [bacterium]
MKTILDLCGGTGAWSAPYKQNGYKVINVTLPKYDVKTYKPPKGVYGVLAAPPCTMFSHARTKANKPRSTREAMEVVRGCLGIIWELQYGVKTGAKDTQLKFWALENPNHSVLKNFIGKPAMVFNPYDFGDNYNKQTGLWGNFNEPKKKPVKVNKPKFNRLLTKEIAPEYFGKLSRTERRAITPKGFAQAFYEVNK